MLIIHFICNNSCYFSSSSNRANKAARTAKTDVQNETKQMTKNKYP